MQQQSAEQVHHPAHYGGADNPHEPIKVIKHYRLNFALGCVIKYVLRAPFKGTPLQDLKKALWYLQDEINEHEWAEALAENAALRIEIEHPQDAINEHEGSEALAENAAPSIKIAQELVSTKNPNTCQECIKPVEEAGGALCDDCFAKRFGHSKVRDVSAW